MPQILLVDDERLLVKGLKRSLEESGFTVVTAYDGEQALSVLQNTQVDLVVLDIMLPKIDGLEVCRRIRKRWNTPVIMLTARGEDTDKIVGLELGADDYLAKPFNTRELVARIRAVLRRTAHAGEEAPAGVLQFGDLEIDIPRQRVTVAGRPVELTATEFDLLSTLARRPGRVFTREILLEQVWGSPYTDPRTVDVYIRRIREKIEPDPAHPCWVMTKRGSGYFFKEQE
ncbi:MAG: response regulator transcription factor [Bacillota bacterium]|nr:response regulator transcription factor [Thermoanaerobacteraceae bacterium]